MRKDAPPLSRLIRVPLYRQAMEQIRRSLQGRRSGERIDTEAALVRQLGVSVFTIRQALAELEKEGLIVRRQGSGCFVSDGPPASKHVAILLDVDLASNNLSPFFPKWLRALQRALRAQGIPCRPYLGDRPLDEEAGAEVTCRDLIDDVRLGRVSGIIGILTSLMPPWVAPFRKLGLPTLDATFSDAALVKHSTDSALGYFKKQGCKRIAVIGWESSLDKRHPMSKRLAEIAPGYGLKLDPRLLDFTANGWEPGMGWERFRDIWRSPAQKPDGLFLIDDMLFDDARQAMEELGIQVPRDIAVAVKTSDAVHLPGSFPVHRWVIQTQPLAEAYASAMKSLLEGKPAPRIKIRRCIIEEEVGDDTSFSIPQDSLEVSK